MRLFLVNFELNLCFFTVSKIYFLDLANFKYAVSCIIMFSDVRKLIEDRARDWS